MVEMLPRGREMFTKLCLQFNDGSCVELKGDFNWSLAGTVQNWTPN